jgi:cytidylate kinase
VEPIDLITISRQFGAGGGELAATLGARLGWRVLDQDLPERVARRLDVDVGDVAARDEHAPRILERIGSVVLRTSPDFAPTVVVPRVPGPDEIAEATRAVLREAAASPPLIVVGHGAQALFHDRPGTLHVRLVAPLAQRVRRICARAGCTGEDAAALARRMDDERVFYVRHYYHRDWHDPLLYHLQLNTGALSLAEASRLVLGLVERRRPRAPAGRSPAADGATP